MALADGRWNAGHERGPELTEELAPCAVLESALTSASTADDLRSLPAVVNESRKR
jgi:hypothetical protein